MRHTQVTGTALIQLNMCIVTAKPSCNLIAVELRGCEGYLYIFVVLLYVMEYSRHDN